MCPEMGSLDGICCSAGGNTPVCYLWRETAGCSYLQTSSWKMSHLNSKIYGLVCATFYKPVEEMSLSQSVQVGFFPVSCPQTGHDPSDRLNLWDTDTAAIWGQWMWTVWAQNTSSHKLILMWCVLYFSLDCNCDVPPRHLWTISTFSATSLPRIHLPVLKKNPINPYALRFHCTLKFLKLYWTLECVTVVTVVVLQLLVILLKFFNFSVWFLVLHLAPPAWALIFHRLG